jgi:VWFA-related protein
MSPRQDSPTFAVAVNLIKVPITVFDTRGVTVQDLRREDFILYEDQARQQIRSFGIDRQPVSVILLLDNSATVGRELAKMKETAESFADALSHDDRVSLITFGDEVILQQDWTADTHQVRKTLRKIKPGLRTALYDGMYSAAREQLRDVEGRKAIILLTDCLNNQSTIGFEDAALSIIQSQATLYVVSKTVMVRQDALKQRRVVMLADIYKRLFGDGNYIEEFFQKREQEMIDLAEKTGGRCYFPTGYDQINGVYEQVARELKNQHFLTYVSNQGKAPNSYHNISIEYLPSSGKLIYRRGYYYEPRAVHKRPLLKKGA